MTPIPHHTYASADPDCPAGRKWLCIGWLSKGCATFHYGASEAEARYKLKAWIEAQKEAELKLKTRVTKQQRKIAQLRATAAREAESALWGPEEVSA